MPVSMSPVRALYASGVQDVGTLPMTKVADMARIAAGEPRALVMGLENRTQQGARRVLDAIDGIRGAVAGAAGAAPAPVTIPPRKESGPPLSPATQVAVDKLPGPVADATEIAIETIKARPVLSAVGAGLGLLAVRKLLGLGN